MAQQEIITNLVIGLITGIVSGLITGVITGTLVTRHFNKKQEDNDVYFYWLQYISSIFDKSTVHLPADKLLYLGPLGGQKSEFGKAILEIDDIVNPAEDSELSKQEQKLSEAATKALVELQKWAKERGIR